MNKKSTILILLLIIASFSYSQNFQDVVKEAETEDEIDEVCQSASLGFMSTPREIEDAVKDILNTVGINLNRANFKLRDCSNINNAVAKILKDNRGNDVRYVIYDPQLFQILISKTSSPWAPKFVLAHEIGHHMYGHSLNDGSSNHQYELDADYFAGKALATLGATLEETLSAMILLPENASFSHPARSERIKKATEGWESVSNKTRTIQVRSEDIAEIGKNIVLRARNELRNSGLTTEDYQRILQALSIAKNQYYRGYTEEIRLLEALTLTGAKDYENAIESYINYLSIENLDSITGIKTIVNLLVESPVERSFFFQNPTVIYELSENYFGRKNYDRAIIFGTQFLQFNTQNTSQKVTRINQIIGDSEYFRIGYKPVTPEKTIPAKIESEKNKTNIEPVINTEEEEKPDNLNTALSKANSYFEGKDFENAYLEYLKATKFGNAHAQERVGFLLYNGRGVKRDRVKAIEFWKIAAGQGNAAAINFLTRLGEW